MYIKEEAFIRPRRASRGFSVYRRSARHYRRLGIYFSACGGHRLRRAGPIFVPSSLQNCATPRLMALPLAAPTIQRPLARAAPRGGRRNRPKWPAYASVPTVVVRCLYILLDLAYRLLQPRRRHCGLTGAAPAAGRWPGGLVEGFKHRNIASRASDLRRKVASHRSVGRICRQGRRGPKMEDGGKRPHLRA